VLLLAYCKHKWTPLQKCYSLKKKKRYTVFYVLVILPRFVKVILLN